ncbi:uncharacterized protein LOC143150907 [Ptiloglossa arizonensis]|uniref:uncharacterized protein LOC143150907 n=1 Tax=Ptiloglossa arizonensis TaxID=3350558 RepID=UPI003F9F6B9D
MRSGRYCASFKMGFVSAILFCSTLILSVGIEVSASNIVAGYIPGISGMPTVNETNCLNNQILSDSSLSDPIECARTCYAGDPPKTCYYKFIVERYPVNGQACEFCNPNFTNTMCADCQCVVANQVERMALTVNRMLPGPSIQACLGDRLVIDVTNQIRDDAITIHWHGIFQNGYQYNDGVPFVNQCPIVAGTTFRYDFVANNSGTHFWHAHTGLQKMDGIYGTLVIREPEENEPNAWLYDFDLAHHVIIISDWINEETTERVPGRNNGRVGQLPDAVLINGKGQSNSTGPSSNNTSIITVDANESYRFRLVNSFCGTCSAILTIEGHSLIVIATDGRPIKPTVVNSIVSFAGERYDFVLNTNRTPGSYWIQLRALDNCANSKIQSVAKLQYTNASGDQATPLPTYDSGISTGIVMNAIDSGCNSVNSVNSTQICINNLQSAEEVDPAILKEKPDLQFYLTIGLFSYELQELFTPNTYNNFLVPATDVSAAALINGISYEAPPSPLISQSQDLPEDQFCNIDNLPPGCNGTCSCTHMINIPLNSVVEIIMIDSFHVPELDHPFHLHGHTFSVLAMGQPFGPTQNSTDLMSSDFILELDKNNGIPRNLVDPPSKDTLVVPNNGYTVFRFRATNPGYWFYHCHFVFHQEIGMELVLHVGEQKDLPPVPKNFPRCGNFLPPI